MVDLEVPRIADRVRAFEQGVWRRIYEWKSSSRDGDIVGRLESSKISPKCVLW